MGKNLRLLVVDDHGEHAVSRGLFGVWPVPTSLCGGRSGRRVAWQVSSEDFGCRTARSGDKQRIAISAPFLIVGTAHSSSPARFPADVAVLHGSIVGL
jgi:hypothetical protein